MRQFIRHPASIPVQLEALDGELKHGINTLNNVSFGGISCLSSEPLEKGQTVRLKIECVNSDFEIIGKVIRCYIKDNRYEIGIEFIVSKDQVFHLRMIEQICHIEHYRNEILHYEGRELSSKEAAKEWIEKFASNFPTA
jgi:hypothetical protein